MRENVTLRSTSWLFVIGISLLCAVPGATRVEAQAVRAAILGTVRDGTGAALPGVTIDARNTGTGVSQSVTTNGQGRFNLPDLPLGTYDVQASLAGFQSVVHKGLTLTVEAIAEFQTLTNTYSAQFGGGGAAINAITRSGANVVHGSAFEFVRDSAFDARQFFDDPSRPKPPFSKNQYGGSAGGPIRKDKAFFFLNYEGITQSLGETRIATVPDANARNGLIPIGGALTSVGVAAAIKPVLDLYPLPTTPLGGGVGQVNEVDTTRGHENYFLGRFDYVLSSKQSFFARYVSDTADLFEPFSGSNIPLWSATNKTNNQIFTGEARRIVSGSVINQVRIGVVRTRELADNTGEV